jgi:hypothetical protein
MFLCITTTVLSIGLFKYACILFHYYAFFALCVITLKLRNEFRWHLVCGGPPKKIVLPI